MRALAVCLALILASSADADTFRRRRKNVVVSTLAFSAAMTGNCEGTNITGVKGTAISVNRATSAYCTKTDGTLTSIATNLPRVNGNGLLIEPSATNLALRSQELGTTWTAAEVTVTANAQTAPDGTATAETLTESANTAEHQIYQAITVTNGATYTSSIIAKAGTRTYIRLADASASHTAIFNLSTCAVQAVAGTGTAAAVESLVSSWCRVSMTFAAGTADNFHIVNMCDSSSSCASYAGNGTGTVHLWGGQLEAGTYASSYIVTTSASATRSRDNVTVVTPAAINDVEGCMSFSFKRLDTTGFFRILDSSPFATYGNADATQFIFQDTGGAHPTANVSTVVGTNTSGRISWGPGNTETITIGSTSNSSTKNTPIFSSPIYLGSDDGAAQWLKGYLSNLKMGTSSDGCR